MKIQKAYKNTNQSHAASHCCQSPVPCKSADYGNIRRVKQLLQNTAECQRYGKDDQLAGKTAV